MATPGDGFNNFLSIVNSQWHWVPGPGTTFPDLPGRASFRQSRRRSAGPRNRGAKLKRYRSFSAGSMRDGSENFSRSLSTDSAMRKRDAKFEAMVSILVKFWWSNKIVLQNIQSHGCENLDFLITMYTFMSSKLNEAIYKLSLLSSVIHRALDKLVGLFPYLPL